MTTQFYPQMLISKATENCFGLWQLRRILENVEEMAIKENGDRKLVSPSFPTL